MQPYVGLAPIRPRAPRRITPVIQHRQRRRTGGKGVHVVTTLTRCRNQGSWILPNWSRAAARAVTVASVEPNGSLLTARIAAGDDRALAEAYDLVATAVHAAAARVLGSACAAQ